MAKFNYSREIKCPQFSYAVMIAQRLKEHLPEFNYTKISKKSGDWERWLVKICKENEWYHIQSPLIWKEISMIKGKKYYVGDINKFLDLCRDYYGLPRELLAAGELERAEMNWFTKRTESEYFEDVEISARENVNYRCRQICITGAASAMTDILIMELLQISIQNRKDGMEIRLYDEPSKEKKLHSIAADAMFCSGRSGLGTCRVVTDLKQALTNVDMVLVLDAFIRKQCESMVKWLKRNRNAMCVLGKALNKYACTHCRVIIGGPNSQPLCYNATVLASFAKKMHVRNIVVVTQDLGREMLTKISKVSNVPLKDLYCPPVWGFVGLNKFVDVRNTLQNYSYKVPGRRLRSTLPQGSEELEIRTINCMIRQEEVSGLYRSVASHKNDSYPRLGRFPCLAKVTAILDLLKVWTLGQEDGNGEILCLGVYSDGTFGIPKGIYWSQPVALEKGFWTPFPDYPIPRSYDFNLYSLFPLSVASCYRTKVTPRIYRRPKVIPREKEKKKFNFEEIEKEVGMPVIRTEIECLEYIKTLAKKELGINFDLKDDIISECTEPESTPPESEDRSELQESEWCECWRDELKKLQSLVHLRSNSTELEVDLSENISGSEWSIINPPGTLDKDVNVSDEAACNATGLSLQPSSSTITVCNCPRKGGESCHCLKKHLSGEKDSSSGTEKFYESQNAQVFDGDSYEGKKAVHFDGDIQSDDDKEKFHLKFYGKKDAIRDEETDKEMRKRILRYEREVEEILAEGQEEEEEEEEEESMMCSEEGEEEEEAVATKFHVTAEGAAFEILGDPDGLEALEEKRRSTVGADSIESFKDMWADEITPALQLISTDTETGETRTTETSSSMSERVREPIGLSQDREHEIPGEGLELPVEQCIEIAVEEEENKHEPEAGRKEERKRRRWEGIPKCLLCHCIVPEGLLGCPCGETTVVEVFKKESEEVFVESEGELSFRVEYVQEHSEAGDRFGLSDEEDEGDESGREGEEGEDADALEKDKSDSLRRDIFNLPPETFVPFKKEKPNRFLPPKRPDELSQKYMENLKEPEEVDGVPYQCIDLLRLAEEEFEDERNKQKAESDEKRLLADMSPGRISDKEGLSTIPEESDDGSEIKTQFSNLKFVTPAELEDWRAVVQTKYREWFLEGTAIKDECYYEPAIEEVSEDECQIDEDLKIFFEN